jgi:hypothetical protein
MIAYYPDDFDYVEQQVAFDSMKPKCPVNIGDIFYRKRPNDTIPDKLEVIEIKEMPEGGYFIKGKYLYHAIGQRERIFSDIIFKDDNWVIERRGTTR